jgi:hypothetical protein
MSSNVIKKHWLHTTLPLKYATPTEIFVLMFERREEMMIFFLRCKSPG